MKKPVKKMLQRIILAMLIGCFIVMPVSAKTSTSGLAIADYQQGMDSLANVTEEEWINSVETAISTLSTYDGNFIEVGNSEQASGTLAEKYGIQANISTFNLNGIVSIGNQIKNISKKTLTNAEDENQESIEKEEDVQNDVEETDDSQNVVEESKMPEEETDDSQNIVEESKTPEEETDDSQNIVEESKMSEEEKDNLQNTTKEKYELQVLTEESQFPERTDNAEDTEEETGEQQVSKDVAKNDTEEMSDVGELLDDSTILTAPTAGLQPVVLNEETLRDGMATTKTEIAWLFTGDAAIYYYGGFQADYYLLEATDGFVTKFYTPGTYSVLCYGENSAGETSEITGFTITVLPEFEAQTIEDSLTSATDSKTYSINIDFTKMDTAAICLVRTGKSEIKMQITDDSGNIIPSYATAYSIPKRWVYIDKPSQAAQTCHYNITVTTTSFKEASGAFRIIAGNKDDAEAMMGGLENAVDLDMYFDSKNNYISSDYSPRSDEYWFITSMPFPTFFTLLSNDSTMRFKLKDMDTLQDVFDSNDSQWERMHSTSFTGSFSRAEKVTFEALTGTRRYLVVYSNNPSVGSGVLEKPFQLGAGQPMYGITHQTVYGSPVTVGASGYSSTTLNANTSSFANTGVMNEAFLSGVSLGKLDRWRLSAPGTSSYKTSFTGSTYITYNFTPGGSLNTGVKGSWNLGIKLKSGNSSTSYYPSVDFSFYYQYGDDTITIVPAN